MQNLYVINQDTANANGTPYLEPGIHDNVKMTEVKYETTVKGNEFLAFTWQDESGNKVTLTEWPYRMPKPFESMSAEEQDKTKGIINSQMSRIKQILEVYIGKISDELINSPTFKEFATKVVNLLEGKYADKLVRVKVVYDDKGWTIVSNRSKYQFIESMDIPKEESSIKMLAGDKTTRPEKNIEKKEVNPLEEAESTTTDAAKGDLPF
jgi:hypothetical protein